MSLRTCNFLIVAMATLVSAGGVLPPALGDDAQLAHVDAILHAKQQADGQVRLLTTQLATALQDADERDRTWTAKVTDAETRASNAAAAQAEIENSWAYWIGWTIVRAFRWWITALITAFAIRLICSLPWFAGNPFAAVGAHVSTWCLHVLTLGLTLTTNVPDNLYFLGEIRRLKAERKAAQVAAFTNGASAAEVAGETPGVTPGGAV